MTFFWYPCYSILAVLLFINFFGLAKPSFRGERDELVELVWTQVYFTDKSIWHIMKILFFSLLWIILMIQPVSGPLPQASDDDLRKWDFLGNSGKKVMSNFQGVFCHAWNPTRIQSSLTIVAISSHVSHKNRESTWNNWNFCALVPYRISIALIFDTRRDAAISCRVFPFLIPSWTLRWKNLPRDSTKSLEWSFDLLYRNPVFLSSSLFLNKRNFFFKL